MAVVVDCKTMAQGIIQGLTTRVNSLVGSGLARPGLAVVRVGDDPASRVYFDNKKRQAEQCGITFFEVNPGDQATEAMVEGALAELAQDQRVHGIMVELPLPEDLNAPRLQAAILPEKDIEGVTPGNLGRLFLGIPAFVPCTAKAAMHVLDELGIDPKGKQAVVVGSSNIVGKPLAMLLLARWATVEVCHIFTQDLASRTQQADLLFSAAGVAGLIKPAMVKPGATVVDIGINFVDNKVVGDVDFASVEKIAGQITPVPGGVGALTTSMLLENVVEAAEGCREK